MRRAPNVSKIAHVFKFILMAFIFCCAVGFSVQYLWNWLIPELFHGPVITFWQALGLCLLGKLVFGWHGNGAAPWGARAKQKWRARMMEKMQHMSEEEREKLREKLRRCTVGPRWGQSPFDDEKQASKTETNL